jgi:hypothetical protein
MPSAVFFSVNERALFRLIDQEAVILNLDNGEYFGLNAVAARVWELLAKGCSVNSTFEALLTEYEVDSPVLRADLEELLADLLKAGLIVEREEDAPVSAIQLVEHVRGRRSDPLPFPG